MFERDHATIHGLIDRAVGDEWTSAAVALVDELGEHILREESDLFPVAHQLLTPEQWTRISDDQRTETGSLL